MEFKQLQIPTIDQTTGQVILKSLKAEQRDSGGRWTSGGSSSPHQSDAAFGATARANVASKRANNSNSDSAAENHLEAYSAHKEASRAHKEALDATGDKTHADNLRSHREQINYHLAKATEAEKATSGK